MKKLSYSLFIMAFFASTNASAGEGDWYIQGSAGYNWHNDLDATRTLSLGAVSTDVPVAYDFSTGHTGSLGFGYEYTDSIRFDLEYAHRSNDVSAYKNRNTSVTLGRDGHIKSNSVLVNGTYEFQTDWVVNPFIGAGVGVSHVESEVVETTGTMKEDDAWAFSGQLKAGLGWDVSENVELFTQYQYFHIFNPDLNPTAPDSLLTGITYLDSTHEGNRLSSSALSIGVRYSF